MRLVEKIKQNEFCKQMSPLFAKESKAELRSIFTVSKKAPLSEKLMLYCNYASFGLGIGSISVALFSPVQPVGTYFARIGLLAGPMVVGFAVGKLSWWVNVLTHGKLDYESGQILPERYFKTKNRMSKLRKLWKSYQVTE